MASKNTTSDRYGDYREKAIEEYGSSCNDCGWSPSDGQRHLLHVHHKSDSNDVSDLEVLCRDCHLDRHHPSKFSHEFVGMIVDTFVKFLDHKKDGFGKRVKNRAMMDSAIDVGHKQFLVEGLMDGDKYDSYSVDLDANHMDMCSCYQHNYGSRRARNVCTHAGASLVWKLASLRGEYDDETILKTAKKRSKSINRKASSYVEKYNKIQDKMDHFKENTGYKKSHLERGRAQALRMAEHGQKWKCFSGACEGSVVTVGRKGYVCTCEEDNGYPPCPGEVGAYILNNI